MITEFRSFENDSDEFMSISNDWEFVADFNKRGPFFIAVDMETETSNADKIKAEIDYNHKYTIDELFALLMKLRIMFKDDDILIEGFDKFYKEHFPEQYNKEQKQKDFNL